MSTPHPQPPALAPAHTHPPTLRVLLGLFCLFRLYLFFRTIDQLRGEIKKPQVSVEAWLKQLGCEETLSTYRGCGLNQPVVQKQTTVVEAVVEAEGWFGKK